MILKEIQAIFHTELDVLYPKKEVDSFFFMLCEHYFKIDRMFLALEPQTVISKTEESLIFEALSQLKLEKPIQYIIGETTFFGMNFTVNKHTLIPRPETEDLVQWILEDTKAKNLEKPTILDIGTGSGCIAVSLAKNIKNAEVSALDISKDALKIAKQNAKNNKVTISFIEEDILVETKKKEVPFDIIVSNPPYVRELEKEQMQNNVILYEPKIALFVANENPLQFYDAIADFALKNLTKNGVLYFEINQYLGSQTMQLLKGKGFQKIILKKDVFGVDRMVKAIFS